MPQDLYLIRHGATEGSDKKTYKGTIDVPLSELGKSQAQKTGLYMKELGLEPMMVYCSDLARAIVSAEMVCQPYGLVPTVVPELRERHFGLWEGLTFDEISSQYPDAFAAWAKDPLNFSPLEGESTLEVKERVIPAIEALLKKHRNEDIAVVAHGGVNRNILCHLMGLPLEYLFRIEQDFACLNKIRIYDDGLPVVKLLNGGGHEPQRP